MKPLLILLTLCFAPLFSEEHFSRTLEALVYRYDVEPHFAHIKLSDGSIWKWYPDKYSEHFLCSWSLGDEIIIRTHNHPGYLLDNSNKPYYSPIVALNFNSYPLFPVIENIDEDATGMILSDGSRWKILYDFNKRTLLNWKSGDRIIPVQGLKNFFELINLDIPPDQRNRIERNIQVVPAA